MGIHLIRVVWTVVSSCSPGWEHWIFFIRNIVMREGISALLRTNTALLSQVWSKWNKHVSNMAHSFYKRDKLLANISLSSAVVNNSLLLTWLRVKWEVLVIPLKCFFFYYVLKWTLKCSTNPAIHWVLKWYGTLHDRTYPLVLKYQTSILFIYFQSQLSIISVHSYISSLLCDISVLQPFPAVEVKTFTPNLGWYLMLSCLPPPSYPQPEISWATVDEDGKFTLVNVSDRVTIDYDGRYR